MVVGFRVVQRPLLYEPFNDRPQERRLLVFRLVGGRFLVGENIWGTLRWGHSIGGSVGVYGSRVSGWSTTSRNFLHINGFRIFPGVWGCDGMLLRGLLVDVLGVPSFKLSIVDNLDYSIYLQIIRTALYTCG